MCHDLEQLIRELEEVTARMVGANCGVETSEFGELLEARRLLCARFVNRHDLDGTPAERIQAVIQAGTDVAARVVATRESLLAAITQTNAQRRFTHELAGNVSSQARICLDLNV